MAHAPRTTPSAAPSAQGRPPGGIERGHHGSVLTYVTGLGFAIILTLASFWAAGTDLVWQPAVPMLLAALAIGQMGVHVVFFFHISTGPGDTNNFLALAFGVFVVGLVVFGSMLIMSNLEPLMPTMDQLMKMQR
jgi:cytochrome o ubiquinol oxidase operon protein cyoD